MRAALRALRMLTLGAALLAGCAMEVADQEEDAVESTETELRRRWPPIRNPCVFTSCPTGTTCEVQDGEAVCVPRDEPVPGACGPVTCSEGTLCCNASCGICVPPGRACIQIACNTP